MDKLSTAEGDVSITSYPQDPLPVDKLSLTPQDPNDYNVIDVEDDNDRPYIQRGKARAKAKSVIVKGEPSTPRQSAYQTLRLSGIAPEVAVKAAGYKCPRTAEVLDRKLAGLPEAVRLDSARKLKLASFATERLVRGLPIGKVRVVKDTTVLGAAEAIYKERARREGYQGPDSLTINLIDLRPFSGLVGEGATVEAATPVEEGEEG